MNHNLIPVQDTNQVHDQVTETGYLFTKEDVDKMLDDLAGLVDAFSIEGLDVDKERQPEEVPETQTIPKLEPESEELFDRAWQHYRDMEFETALEMFTKVVAMDPDNSKARFLISRINKRMN